MLFLSYPSPSFPLSFFVLLLSPLCLLPDGFDFGAAADADRGQAQRVFGEPDGDRSTSPETRGGLKMAALEGGRAVRKMGSQKHHKQKRIYSTFS